jgi:hypothetical protein
VKKQISRLFFSISILVIILATSNLKIAVSAPENWQDVSFNVFFKVGESNWLNDFNEVSLVLPAININKKQYLVCDFNSLELNWGEILGEGVECLGLFIKPFNKAKYYFIDKIYITNDKIVFIPIPEILNVEHPWNLIAPQGSTTQSLRYFNIEPDKCGLSSKDIPRSNIIYLPQNENKVTAIKFNNKCGWDLAVGDIVTSKNQNLIGYISKIEKDDDWNRATILQVYSDALKLKEMEIQLVPTYDEKT